MAEQRPQKQPSNQQPDGCRFACGSIAWLLIILVLIGAIIAIIEALR